MGGAFSTTHFGWHEFACRCGCGGNGTQVELIQRLEQARVIYGRSILVTSGYRCPDRDALVAGKGNHTTGLAADLACTSGADRLDLVTALLAVGFRRIGIAERFVHADLVDARPDSIWLYPPERAS